MIKPRWVNQKNATGRAIFNSNRREWVQDALWVCPQDMPAICLANYQLPVVLFFLHYYPTSIYLDMTLYTNATKNLLFSGKIYLVCGHLLGLLAQIILPSQSPGLMITQSVLRKVHSLFQSEFCTGCGLLLHLSISNILHFLKIIK